MTVARHGIFPVSDRNGNIYVAGGGVKAGASQSGVNTVYHMCCTPTGITAIWALRPVRCIPRGADPLSC